VPGGPGSRFHYSPGADRPDRNPDDPELEAPFVCDTPYGAFEASGRPATPLRYGHGLLGSRNEVTSGSDVQMRLRNFMTCAAPWIGMSQEDVPNVIGLLQNLSGLPTLVDRAQQGFLNFHFVGRAMIHPDGFASDPAFRSEGWLPRWDRPPIRTSKLGHFSPLVYDGNSQGAIMGGTFMALSPDAPRGVLGVPGMNYSTLLNRSVDWEADPYFTPTADYPRWGSAMVYWDSGNATPPNPTSRPTPTATRTRIRGASPTAPSRRTCSCTGAW
jgi:hypothetical protein